MWWKILLLVLLIIFIILFIIGNYLFRVVFDRNLSLPTSDDNPLMEPTGKELEEFNNVRKEKFLSLNFETLTIQSFDNLKLYGNFIKGENEDVTIICVHGYRSSMLGDFVGISEIYLKRKYNILLVENRGHLRSEGKYLGFSELDRFDIASWVKKIKEMYPHTKIFLHGNSMGAASVVHTADMDLDINGIVSDCGFTSILDITRHLISGMFKVPYFPFGEMARLNAWLFAKVSFDKSNSKRIVKNSKVPIVFISGTEDNFVPIQMTLDTYENCNSKKYLLLVEGAGHVASYMKDPVSYEKVVYQMIDDVLKGED